MTMIHKGALLRTAAATISAAVGLLLATPLAAGAKSPLAGTWTGEMRPVSGGVVHPYGYRITVSADGRSGSWRSRNCYGTLALARIHGGYAIFHEHLTGGTPCSGNGTDQLKRVGSGLRDAFKSHAGGRFDSSGTLRRG